MGKLTVARTDTDDACVILSRLGVFFKVIVELSQFEVYRSVMGSCGDECPFQTLNRFSRSISRHVRESHIV